MASGPEMMMNALLKAMGFDPRQFIAQIQLFITQVQEQFTKFNRSAQSLNDRVEENQKSIEVLNAKLDLLIALHQGKVLEHGLQSEHKQPHVVNIPIGINGYQSSREESLGRARSGDDPAERSDANEGSGGNIGPRTDG